MNIQKDGLEKTLELIEALKATAMEVTEKYKDGTVDPKGNYLPPSPEKIGYLLTALVQVAKLEREIKAETTPTQGVAMVPFDIN